MPETFKCPTCAAPLKFEGKMLQNCAYCGGSIIVPADMFREKKVDPPPPKIIKLNEIFSSVFSNRTPGQTYVLDLRSSSRRAQRNIQNVHAEIRAGHHSKAVDIFTQTFGFQADDAEKTVTAMERGRGVDVSEMRLYPNAPVRSGFGWIIKLVIGLVILMFILPFIFTILMFLLMYLLGA